MWTVNGFFNVSGFLPVDEDHVESDNGSINSVNKRSKKVDKLFLRGRLQNRKRKFIQLSNIGTDKTVKSRNLSSNLESAFHRPSGDVRNIYGNF